jgi:hypothetical protein
MTDFPFVTGRNYEECDRCNSRFQVFPNRDELTGRLTTSGPCHHHPKKKTYPHRTKGDTGPKEAYYPCCGQTVGTAGCKSYR